MRSQQQPQPVQLSAQEMVGSQVDMVTPYRTGMDTHTCWVRVTVHMVPSALVVQVTVGLPWQVTVGLPITAVGHRITGAVTSTHWVLTLLQPFMGQDSSD